MRSMAASAWRISSRDSSRLRAASRPKLQCSWSLAWAKYWFTGVSSELRTSLSSWRISGFPEVPAGSRTGGGEAVEVCEQRHERRMAPPAPATGTAAGRHRVEVARALVDGLAHGPVAHRPAVAEDHRAAL